MQIRKKGGWNLKKIFSETIEPISTDHSDKVWLKLAKWFSNMKIFKRFFAYLCLICIIGQNRQKFKVHKKFHNPFKIVSVSAVLYPRWLQLLKIEISSNGQNCSILSQNVHKFELYKHNYELFNINYRISNDYFINI
jgi:hypothetical protein